MKSKLSTTIAFLAVFIFSLALQSAFTPQSTVEAANTAEATCRQQYPQADQTKACVIGYNGGYGFKTLEQICGSQGDPVSGITYGGPTATYSFCAGGYQFGVSQRNKDGVKAPNLSNDDLNDRAKRACKAKYGDSGDKAEACQRGYKAAFASGASSRTVTAACNKFSTEELRTACREGVDAADRNGIEVGVKQASSEVAGIEEAEEECKNANQTGGRAAPCIKGYTGALSGTSKTEACKEFPNGSDRKEACEKGHALGTAKKPKDQADCDTTLTSVLSWIACPIIDMGVNFTDWVFEDFIQPMLETVPVSTNPEDGSYKAWSQFRLIANILLVGSLLAIVYSQAKGGGGR